MQASFVYAGEHPLMRIDASGNAVYYLEDATGSVLGLADDTGSEVARFAYDSFGIERSSSGSQAALPSSLHGDFRYHGQWQEASTGLYFVRARNYDPATGRFTSRDPFEGVFEEPESFHPYTWVANNPRVYRDPLGLFSLTSISVGQGIQSTLRNAGRQAILDFFRTELRDRVQGVAGDLLLSFFKGLLPVDASAIDGFLGVVADPGGEFEELILNQVCNGLGVPQQIRDNTRAFARFAESGAPASNGISCLDFDVGFALGRTNLNEIDIVFTPIALTSSLGGEPSVAGRDGKAYLPVELKVNARGFAEKRSQLNAISGFAGDHVGGRIALLVAVRGGAAAQRLEKVLATEMVENGALVLLITLVD